jgi:hypothetical protein
LGPLNYDYLPDGRVVGIGSPLQITTATAPLIQVVLNWFEDLKQRVPAK